MIIMRKSCLDITQLIIILIDLLCIHFVQGVDFTEQPEDLNATVNSTRVFQCRAERGFSYSWTFNGTRVDPASPPDGIVVGGNSLSIYCDEAYNMSRVMCVAFLDDFTRISSDSATLLIQGRLKNVTDFEVASTNSTSITITWVPPFSLDITGVDPDFTHTVVVYNNNTGNSTTFEGIVEPTFTFFLEEPNPLHVFEFFVTAVNELGLEGESSDPVQGCVLGPVTDVTVSSNETAITITWDHPDISDPGLPPTYRVDVYNASDPALPVLETTYTNELMFIFTMDKPSPYEKFEIIVTPNTCHPGEAVSHLAYFIGTPIEIPGLEVEVDVNFALTSLEILFIFNEEVVAASPGQRPTSYRVLATNVNSSCKCDVIDDVMNGLVTLMVGDCGGCLSQDEMYNIIIQTINEVGVSNSTGTIWLNLTSTELTTTESTNFSSLQPESKGTSGTVQVTVSIFVSLIICTLVGGATLGSIITLLVVLIATRVRKQATVSLTSQSHSNEIEMKNCDAYDVVSKHKQLKRNPPTAAAYEEVDL